MEGGILGDFCPPLQISVPVMDKIFLSRLVPYSILLLISYLLLPVSLPEGQKDQVGQVGWPAGQSLGQKSQRTSPKPKTE